MQLVAGGGIGGGRAFGVRGHQGCHQQAGEIFGFGPRDILVNAVAPGVVDTDMSSFAKTEQGRNFTLGIQALKRVAGPEDIGGVFAFLASEEARWITGDTIQVDGGSKL